MVRALVLAVPLALLLAGCTSDTPRDEPLVGPLQYGVSYTVGVAEYDDDASQAAFNACVARSGASFAGSEDSLPPGLSVRFEGTAEQQEELEACLRALPDTRLQGPFEVPDRS